jgi:hypothetical protein
LFVDHRDRRYLFALLRGQRLLRRGLEPDVDVESGLVAAVTLPHRPAAWLPEVADEQVVPSHRVHCRGELANEVDRHRVSVEPVAGGAHHLVAGPV